MAWVQIPVMLAEYTGGLRRVEAAGARLRQIIEHLDHQFPGIASQICQGEKILPTWVVTVDGKLAVDGLNSPVGPSSEVFFLPFLGGG